MLYIYISMKKRKTQFLPYVDVVFHRNPPPSFFSRASTATADGQPFLAANATELSKRLAV